MAIDLTIILPAFNEAHRLGEGFKRFDAAVDAGAIDLERTEVVVVDDGSTDSTAETARSLLAHIPHHRIVGHPRNQGKGAAVRTGVALALGTHTAYMDADFAIDPTSVPLLVEGLRTNDVVIGSRALADSMVESSYALRSVMGNLFNRMVTVGTGLGYEDTQCGFKAFRTPVARVLFHLVRIDRFAFDVEILSLARRLGLRIAEVPVQWRHVPGSTIHPLHDSMSMLGDVYRFRLGMVPVPPISSVVVGEGDRSSPAPPSRPASLASLAADVGGVVADTLGATPVPVVTGSTSVTVLLPLVERAKVAEVVSALQAEFASFGVRRRASTPESLASLGPLSGRLEPSS
jgi:glycosyltransferase involved in cell wall biosynthesis